MATASNSTNPSDSRTRARVRFVLASALFVGWLAWLAFLAFSTRNPVVLSRPQFLAASVVVSADVAAEDGRPKPEVVVRQILLPGNGPKQPAVGQTVTVTNLSEVDANGQVVLPPHWQGPGRYILPLVEDGDRYRVAAIPPSPGFTPRPGQPPPVYPETPETLHQLEHLPPTASGAASARR